MKKSTYKWILITGLFLLAGCEDYYVPEIEPQPDALVVEGILTDRNEHARIKLSRSAGFNDRSFFSSVQKATVSIESEQGESWPTGEISKGLYETLSPVSTRTGESYFLKIRLSDGTEYRSESEIMLPPSPIDSIYLTNSLFKDVYLNYWGEPEVKNFTGITFSVKPRRSPGTDPGFLYQWNALLNYYVYSTELGTDFPYYCWKQLSSKLIYVYDYGQDDRIVELPLGDLHFLSYYTLSPEPIDTSWFEGTIVAAYSTGFYYHLTQYAITSKGARFWRSVRNQTEASGKLFDPIEEQIIGNIYCVSDSTKVAFGYFNTASLSDRVIRVTMKREPFTDYGTIDIMPTAPSLHECLLYEKTEFWF